MNKNLLLFLQALDDIYRDLENVRHDIRRCERKPLRQRYICDALSLVDFDKGQVLCFGGIFNIMAYAVVSNASYRGERGPHSPELSGKTAVSPGLKLKVRELLFPVNTVA